MDAGQLTERMLVREQAANVRKHWVRLVTACNSRCVFCLDTDTPRNVYLLEADVRKELERGREELRADKVILSGGEGSIHPKFIDFVRYAREIGYDRVQTVTNGYMFAKRDFYLEAVEAGLGEITFSLHGHTPELHDRLTGVEGAYRRLMKGMVRAVRDGRVIVNVDVCINKQNVAYIDQIVALCLSVGVNEFDLLHVIPQGAAFEHRDDLFYDPVEHLPRLQKVFRLNRHPNVVVWTNRFPVEFLEGLEDLIQDPHKMLDEVNGRRFQVRRYLDEGTPLECRQRERCVHCFIEPFCTTADRVIARQNDASWNVWWIGAADRTERLPSARELPFGCGAVGVDVDDLPDVEVLDVPSDVGLYIRPARVSRFVDRTRLRHRSLLALREPEHLDVVLGGAPLQAGIEVEVELNRRTAPWLLAQRERVRTHLDVVRLHQPSHEFLKDAVANDVRDLKGFFTELALPIRTSGLVACLAPGSRLAEAPTILEKKLFDPATGRLAIRELARTHVVHGYLAKSLRCRDCVVSARCEGAHINFLRDQGFAELQPLRNGAWAESAAAQLLALRPAPLPRVRDGQPLQPVAPSLPGFAPPHTAPVEPLIEFAQKKREARERARQEAAQRRQVSLEG
ncbi:MAG: radical SAM protein [Deltaproteobacteria bacterium]|nr:radical SAM protein [Deltaproteobacteria bacterium]